MENVNHSFTEMFKQLGLPSAQGEIVDFITRHKPLPPEVRLEDAIFWTEGQRGFIREQMAADSDWSEWIDRLSLALR
jgi:hypothetical protein